MSATKNSDIQKHNFVSVGYPTEPRVLKKSELARLNNPRPTGVSWLTHFQKLNPRIKALAVASVLSKYGPAVRVSMGGFQSPESVIVKLKYAERITLTSTVGAITYYSFRADCYDPNLTGTGGQPTGFDQWMAFYEKYRVIKSRFINRAGVAYSFLAILAGAALSTGSALSGTEAIADIISMPYSQSQICGGANWPKLDSGWLDSAHILGLTRAEFLANENTFGTASAVAPLCVVWGMGCQTTDVTNT